MIKKFDEYVNESFLGVTSLFMAGVMLYKIIKIGIEKIKNTDMFIKARDEVAKETIADNKNLLAAYILNTIIQKGITVELNKDVDINITKDIFDKWIEKFSWKEASEIVKMILNDVLKDVGDENTKKYITDVIEWLDTPNAKDEYKFIEEKFF